MTYTVAHLRAVLNGLPDDMPVIIQKDAEGNAYSPAAEAEEGLYLADSTYSGETYHTHQKLAELIKSGSGGWTDEDAAPEDAIPALIIAPIN